MGGRSCTTCAEETALFVTSLKGGMDDDVGVAVADVDDIGVAMGDIDDITVAVADISDIGVGVGDIDDVSVRVGVTGYGSGWMIVGSPNQGE